MQSGIAASQELHDAFNTLVSSPTSQRGLVASIKKEALVPIDTVPSSSSDFFEDLAALGSLLKDTEAAYVILRRHEDSPDGYVAVTYVPDTANVRQKTLFASTRLTLVRELGTERFRETIFTTTKDELTAAGWHKHDKHSQLKAPLTEEEEMLQTVKDAEAEASRGTTYRTSHLSGHTSLPISEEALKALKELPGGDKNLIQLKFDVAKETIELASASRITIGELSSAISDNDPRYSFFQFSFGHGDQAQSALIFMYTCPPNSKVKSRMLYAASRAGVVSLAEKEAGLKVAKKLEASSPSEITASMIDAEFRPQQEQKQAFSRPKRPGKR